tara:strand:- start:5268 stop:6923 length:1656 start_codon:yes stop_codon:yes gene_type:complete
MDEEQGLASPIAGGLRGIRRSVSSSIFTGRAVPPQAQGDTISQNLISKNSLTLESVSGQLSGITQQVSSINNSLEAIKNNLQVSDALEKQRQAAKERREAILAEQGLREGKESELEKRIQFALLTPVRRVKQVAQGILSRLTDAFLFLAGGWLVNTTLTFLRLNAEGNEEELKKFKDKLVGSLIIMGGITLAATIAFGKLLALTKAFTASLLLVISANFIKKPFELLFNFIGINLNKFKNMLRLGIVGLVNNVKNVDPKAAAQATRDSKILSRSAAATGGVVATQAFFPNKIRQFNNIFRNMFGKPIVTKEMAAATASKATKVGAFSRLGQFGGKLLNTFNKLFYVVEGVFDFADYKKRGNSNFQAFIGSLTRGVTKYLAFGAGMKTGALIGGFLGGPPGALIGGLLGGIGVGLFGGDEAAANFVGGGVDSITGANQNVEGDTSMNNNSASGNIEGTNTSNNDNIMARPVSYDSVSGIVPFKSREENLDQKLALNEEVEVIKLPLQGNSTPQTGTSGPSKVGAVKVPKFSTSDYANNYVIVAESLFNVSTV